MSNRAAGIVWLACSCILMHAHASLNSLLCVCRTLEEMKAVAGPHAKLEYMLCDVSSFK